MEEKDWKEDNPHRSGSVGGNGSPPCQNRSGKATRSMFFLTRLRQEPEGQEGPEEEGKVGSQGIRQSPDGRVEGKQRQRNGREHTRKGAPRQEPEPSSRSQQK